ncbi:beta-galactosidase [Hyphomonas sp.]|uniref:beta-galactosidase n=1 Tax=Hyphomonas sp. TaxID=87 RepID=UPI001BCD65AD|nr:beta-galactosidase [Hyphomonas sp.]
MKLGVCYYPEHWPEEHWREDAAMMRALGVSMVRIGEFAWSRIEPAPGRFDWGWLDRAVAVLAEAGLGIVLSTPTATPPKWLVDLRPDILPFDQHGHPRRFGSRRHYCFSSRAYRAESRRVTEAVARRYGEHPAVILWQTDNEYGHHGSDESFSPDAVSAFRDWLAARYRSVAALNDAWGTVFWSQEYASFAEVDPPQATVTEANPSHRLDWRRFCSDQMCAFNRDQVDILRKFSPGRPVTHNFIGDFIRLDHRKMGRDLDYASWDSYPIGLLSEGIASEGEKIRRLRYGDPDFAAFNHDVFRACAPKWGVMEQQPGPVNWANCNAAPAAGVVRLWTWEAFAHGAGFVSYFRWRQVPFAQEQMHAALLATDRTPQPVCDEIRRVAEEVAAFPDFEKVRSRIGLLMDYPSLWQLEIQPHGNKDGPLGPARICYRACRMLGQSVDMVFPDDDFDGYDLILVPAVTILTDALVGKLARSGAVILATALSGAREETGRTSAPLPPGPLAALLGTRVLSFESLPKDVPVVVKTPDLSLAGHVWRERIETSAEPWGWFEDGSPAQVKSGNFRYLAYWPDETSWQIILQQLLDERGVPHWHTGPDLRLVHSGELVFAFNYGPDTEDLGARAIGPSDQKWLLGGPCLPPAGVAAWKAERPRKQADTPGPGSPG